MKICRKCGSKVPTSKWAYIDDLCTKCYGKEMYYKRNPDIKKMMSMSKDELIAMIRSREGVIKHHIYRNVYKTAQIRHFRLRIKKIRDRLDYLLEHPFSVGSSYKGSKK